jgi:hypothetical protein
MNRWTLPSTTASADGPAVILKPNRRLARVPVAPFEFQKAHGSPSTEIGLAF